VYEGALRGLLLAYKEHKQHALADPLGVLLARVVVAGLAADPWPSAGSAASASRAGPGGSGGAGGRAGGLGGPVCLVPVPSGAAVARARGGQHVHRVAVAAARELRRAGLRARASPALRVVATRRDSAGLTVAERAENVRGAFAVRAFWRRSGGLAVLVDDLVTTGSTLAEAGRVLATAGVPPSFAATLAATPRRLPRRRCQSPPGDGEAGSL
jgi:predicted amidophosphoribosyltransferase